jgi:hypothetical protein
MKPSTRSTDALDKQRAKDLPARYGAIALPPAEGIVATSHLSLPGGGRIHVEGSS